jgi:hypothetical protein
MGIPSFACVANLTVLNAKWHWKCVVCSSNHIPAQSDHRDQVNLMWWAGLELIADWAGRVRAKHCAQLIEASVGLM